MLARVMDAIRIAERALLASLMIGMSGIYFINVLVREMSPSLAIELAWIDEATLFALCWMVFTGLGLVLERRRHIAMTAFSGTMPPAIASVLQKIINLSGLVFCTLLAKFSFDYAAFTYGSGQISPTLGYSMVVLYAPLPLGFALLALRYLLELCGIQDRFRIGGVLADQCTAADLAGATRC
jgi:C4-dicarboxylate transporter DctQ subunit